MLAGIARFTRTADEEDDGYGIGEPEAEDSIGADDVEVPEEGTRPDWTAINAFRRESGYSTRGGVRAKLASLVLAVVDGPHESNRAGESAEAIARGILSSDDRIFADVERMRRHARRWDQDRR